MPIWRWYFEWHNVFQDRIFTPNQWWFYDAGPLIGRKYGSGNLEPQVWDSLLVIIRFYPCEGWCSLPQILSLLWICSSLFPGGKCFHHAILLLQREKSQLGECFSIFKWLLKATLSINESIWFSLQVPKCKITINHSEYWTSLVSQICLQCGRPRFDPWVGKKPWRRASRPNPKFLLAESPWTEGPGGLLSTGLQRVGHDWASKHLENIEKNSEKLFTIEPNF